jgi:hypothetical protein
MFDAFSNMLIALAHVGQEPRLAYRALAHPSVNRFTQDIYR